MENKTVEVVEDISYFVHSVFSVSLLAYEGPNL